jgi:hypothetical protein
MGKFCHIIGAHGRAHGQRLNVVGVYMLMPEYEIEPNLPSDPSPQ